MIIKDFKANSYFHTQQELTGFHDRAYYVYCVYCAVGAESSIAIQSNINLLYIYSVSVIFTPYLLKSATPDAH
jgi:hypothetical protein